MSGISHEMIDILDIAAFVTTSGYVFTAHKRLIRRFIKYDVTIVFLDPDFP